MPARKPKRRPLSWFARLMAGAGWCSVVGLWIAAGSQYVSPVTFRYVGVLGLTFPMFLGGTVLLFVASLLFARRIAWITLLGLLTCVMSIRRYVPVNIPSPPPKHSLRVLTYNTLKFGSGAHDGKDRNIVAQYMLQSGADVICFQEGHTSPTEWDRHITPLLRDAYPYRDTLNFNFNNNLGCFSKYPIVSREVVYRVGFNASVAYEIVLKQGDTLLVVNNHLASNKLGPADREMYKKIVKDPDDAPMKQGIRQLVPKIAEATVARAVQADSVARYVFAHRRGRSTVVCGDFNDTPISYSRHRMAEGLTDAYVATGQGVGRSFNRDAIFVRIDNMFCSPDLRPYGACVDKSIVVSDHYPLYCNFKRIDTKK